MGQNIFINLYHAANWKQYNSWKLDINNKLTITATKISFKLQKANGSQAFSSLLNHLYLKKLKAN